MTEPRYFISGIDVVQGSYPICDRTTARTPIARCADAEIAQRITALLNADEVTRQKAALYQQRLEDVLDYPITLDDDPLEEGRKIQNEGTDE